LKISEIFNLNKIQRQLDFINIDTENDLPLFLDPYFLSTRNDSWSNNAYRTIQSYFQTVIKHLKREEYEKAQDLFRYLGEPNETCLGVSTGKPRGRGVGQDEAVKIFDHIINSKAIESGLVGHLEDIPIFVENIGKDKISDLTTNVIRKHLVHYTQEQCKLHGIPLTENVQSGYYWDSKKLCWDNILTDMLVINDKLILLVPKGVVSFSFRYTPQDYCDHFVLNFLQNEHVRLRTSLVRVEKLKSGEEKIHPPSKQMLREVEKPHRKEFLREFTKDHPDIFNNFKENTIRKMKQLSDDEISEENFDIVNFVEYLKQELSNVLPGKDQATNFHSLIVGIIEFLFYPNLICPVVEKGIHDGRKRIDITFDNAASEGFFYKLHDIRKFPSQYIAVECKNYTSEIKNPELDQLAGRFSPNRGIVGFLICREIKNKELFIKRCNDTYKDGRGVIIPLDDNDIILLLEGFKHSGEVNDKFLNDRIRDIILN
jgi:hypothetical protein